MPRRLIDQDRRREQRRQALLIDRISRASERLLSREITAAMREIGRAWAATGQIKAPDGHERNVYNILLRTWRVAIESMGGRIREQVKAAGHELTKKQDDDQFFREIQQRYLLTVGGQRIAEDIARTTVEQIMQVVALGRAQGLAQAGISDLINARVKPIGRARGALIARTETHSAGNFGAIETAAQSGIRMKKEWISSDDPRTREDHLDADGQTVGLDEAFNVAGEPLMYPGDMTNGSAWNVINCRCAQGFVVVD